MLESFRTVQFFGGGQGGGEGVSILWLNILRQEIFLAWNFRRFAIEI